MDISLENRCRSDPMVLYFGLLDAALCFSFQRELETPAVSRRIGHSSRCKRGQLRWGYFAKAYG